MNFSPELFAAAPAVVVTLFYGIKRLCGFDLEVRAYRQRRRNEYARGLLESARDDFDRKCLLDDVRRSVDEVPSTIARQNPEQLIDQVTRRAAVLDEGMYEISYIKEVVAQELARRALIPSLRQEVASASTAERRVRAKIPLWALALLDPEEAERCSREWEAHLYERIMDGELREACADRRRFVRLAIVLAITWRAHRVVRSLR